MERSKENEAEVVKEYKYKTEYQPGWEEARRRFNKNLTRLPSKQHRRLGSYRAYRESTNKVILSVCVPCPYTKCNLP